MRWFRRKKSSAPSLSQAQRRAQQSSSLELQHWVGSTLPGIQRLVNGNTEQTLAEAEQYTVIVYEIIRELRRRKETSPMLG